MKQKKRIAHFVAIIIAIIFLSASIHCRKEATNQTFSVTAIDSFELTIPAMPAVTSDSIIHSPNQYSIDIDHNGIADFMLAVNWKANARCGAECNQGKLYSTIFSLNGNSVLDSGDAPFATPLEINTFIGSTSNYWQTGVSKILDGAGNSCCPPSPQSWTKTGIIEKYIGLKIVTEHNTYYGWVHVKVIAASFGGMIIEEYGYNNKPDQAILAGQIK